MEPNTIKMRRCYRHVFFLCRLLTVSFLVCVSVPGLAELTKEDIVDLSFVVPVNSDQLRYLETEMRTIKGGDHKSLEKALNEAGFTDFGTITTAQALSSVQEVLPAGSGRLKTLYQVFERIRLLKNAGEKKQAMERSVQFLSILDKPDCLGIKAALVKLAEGHKQQQVWNMQALQVNLPPQSMAGQAPPPAYEYVNPTSAIQSKSGNNHQKEPPNLSQHDVDQFTDFIDARVDAVVQSPAVNFDTWISNAKENKVAGNDKKIGANLPLSEKLLFQVSYTDQTGQEQCCPLLCGSVKITEASNDGSWMQDKRLLQSDSGQSVGSIVTVIALVPNSYEGKHATLKPAIQARDSWKTEASEIFLDLTSATVASRKNSLAESYPWTLKTKYVDFIDCFNTFDFAAPTESNVSGLKVYRFSVLPFNQVLEDKFLERLGESLFNNRDNYLLLGVGIREGTMLSKPSLDPSPIRLLSSRTPSERRTDGPPRALMINQLSSSIRHNVSVSSSRQQPPERRGGCSDCAGLSSRATGSGMESYGPHSSSGQHPPLDFSAIGTSESSVLASGTYDPKCSKWTKSAILGIRLYVCAINSNTLIDEKLVQALQQALAKIYRK